MKKIAISLSILILLSSCEEEITLDIKPAEEQVSVYGIIENGFPPYVLLTRSMDFFGKLDSQTIANTFISGADVKIIVDGKEYPMVQFNIEQNDFKLIAYIPKPDTIEIPFGGDTLKIPDPASIVYGEIGRTYHLHIEVEGKTITASTTIPDTLGLFDFRFKEPLDSAKADSLVSLYCSYQDPPQPGNFARLLTQRNSEPFYPDPFQSVYTDELINGKLFADFYIPKGEDVNQERSSIYPDFYKGDTVTVKFCAIDKAHYDFWITLETDRNSSGNPFGRPVVIKSNVIGGLGLWGGYGATYRTIIIPE